MVGLVGEIKERVPGMLSDGLPFNASGSGSAELS